MRLLITALAIPVPYLAAMAYGCGSMENSCFPAKAQAIHSVQHQQKQEGVYTCRRAWPQPDEWLPFQSSFIVARDGKDCARYTLQKLPWRPRKLYGEYKPIREPARVAAAATVK